MQTLARPFTTEAGQSVQHLPGKPSSQVTALSDESQLQERSEEPVAG